MALHERTPQASKLSSQPSINTETVARKRQMQRRVTLASLCIGAAISVLIWLAPGSTQSLRDRNGNQRQSGNGSMPRPGFDRGMGGRMRFFQGRRGDGGGPQEWPPPSPRSRYVANLATETDDYTISVRQVMCDEKNLYPGSSFPNRFMGRQDRSRQQDRMLISMQILAHTPSALARIEEFAPKITAVEESGRRLESFDTGQPVHFENGVARRYFLPVPSKEGYVLRSVEGEVLLQPLDATKDASASNAASAESKSLPTRLTFRIENIPMARAPLIYGEVDSVLVDADTALHLAQTPHSETIATTRCLRSKSALSLDAQMPPRVPAIAPLRVTNTLILQQSVSNTFLVPRARYELKQSLDGNGKPKHLAFDKRGKSEPAAKNADGTGEVVEPLRLTLTADIEQNGEIPLHLTFADRQGKQQSVQLQVSAWDDEPMLLLLPPFEASGASEAQNRAVNGRNKNLNGSRNSGQMWTALRLHLKFDEPDAAGILAGSHVNPFTAVAGQRGGELSGSIAITDEPLRSGSIKLKVTPLGTNAKPAEIVALMLDADGAWSLPNLAPGRYSVALDMAMPRMNPMYRSGSWESYVLRRFGIGHPRWQTAPQADLEIAPGGHFTVKTWRVIDTPTGLQGL